jgi:hypothetical protein
VKPIEGDWHTGERVSEALDIGWRHVATHLAKLLGAAAVRERVVAEAGDGAGVAAGRGRGQPAVIETKRLMYSCPRRLAVSSMPIARTR